MYKKLSKILVGFITVTVITIGTSEGQAKFTSGYVELSSQYQRISRNELTINALSAFTGISPERLNPLNIGAVVLALESGTVRIDVQQGAIVDVETGMLVMRGEDLILPDSRTTQQSQRQDGDRVLQGFSLVATGTTPGLLTGTSAAEFNLVETGTTPGLLTGTSAAEFNLVETGTSRRNELIIDALPGLTGIPRERLNARNIGAVISNLDLGIARIDAQQGTIVEIDTGRILVRGEDLILPDSRTTQQSRRQEGDRVLQGFSFVETGELTGPFTGEVPFPYELVDTSLIYLDQPVTQATGPITVTPFDYGYGPISAGSIVVEAAGERRIIYPLTEGTGNPLQPSLDLFGDLSIEAVEASEERMFSFTQGPAGRILDTTPEDSMYPGNLVTGVQYFWVDRNEGDALITAERDSEPSFLGALQQPVSSSSSGGSLSVSPGP